jgi:hypothetical protein
MVSFLFVFSACSSSDSENIAEELLPTTLVRVIHLSPDAPSVDIDFKLVEVQQSIVDLAYTEASTYVEVNSELSEITVKQASDGAEVATIENPSFASDIDNTLYAVNFASNLEFIQSADDRLRDDAQAKVRFVHASPDAPAVDIKVGAADADPVFPAVAFKDIEDYVTVDPGAYSFVVTAANSQTAVVSYEPVTLEAGLIYTVVAHGTLDANDAYDFGVRAFIDSGEGDTFVDLVSVQ